MTRNDRRAPWPGEPARCTCTRMVEATLEETLDCPAGWRWLPWAASWIHAPGRPR